MLIVLSLLLAALLALASSPHHTLAVDSMSSDDSAKPLGLGRYASERAKMLVGNMTLDEKVSMLHGPRGPGVPGGPVPCCECKPGAASPTTQPHCTAVDWTNAENVTNCAAVEKNTTAMTNSAACDAVGKSGKWCTYYSPACAYTGNVLGNSRLRIPPLHMNDGPQGYRESVYPGTTTQFPSGLAVAASWDVSVLAAWGSAMGAEFFAKGANVQLGPGVCLARVPNDGRNFEYLSGEDPFLGATLAGPAVKGIQSHKVIANAKHWVNNNQESNRHFVSEIVDERARFELYYPPFAGAVAAGVGSVMCSYNLVQPDPLNASTAAWSCENPITLGDLKHERGLNFSGFVMSDWIALQSPPWSPNAPAPSLPAGLDMEMPGADHMNLPLVSAALAAGNISMTQIDEAVERILTPMFAVGVMDAEDGAYSVLKHSVNASTPEHIAIAQNLSSQSTVLLKNSDGVLPLKSSANVAVIGLADENSTIYGGTGSGSVIPSYGQTPLHAISAFAEAHGGSVTFTPIVKPDVQDDGGAVSETGECSIQEEVSCNGSDLPNGDVGPSTTESCCAACAKRAGCTAWTLNGFGVHPAGHCFLKANCSGMQEAPPGSVSGVTSRSALSWNSTSWMSTAIAAAKDADVAIIFVGTTSGEGNDRPSLGLGGVQACATCEQDLLVRAIARVQPKTVVSVVSPGAVLLPFSNDVSAILASFMPGQAYGAAICDVLYGNVAPSGKLPVTFPNHDNELNFSTAQWPGLPGPPPPPGAGASKNHITEANYTEGLLVGYRYYDAMGINFTTGFPFGHGTY